jgi:hypothetical protein
MTIKSTTTWNELPENEEFDAERRAWVSQAIEDGKTEEENGTPVEGDPLSFDRFWIDEDAENEWETFIVDLAVKYDYQATVTSTPIVE